MDILNLNGVSPWLSIPLVFLAWVLLLSIAKKVGFRIAKNFAVHTKTQFDDVLFAALDFPLQLMIYSAGVLVVQGFIPKGDVDVMKYLLLGFKAVSIVAVVLFIDKFMIGLIKLYAQKVEILKTAGGIAQGFTRTVVMALGGLILLDSMGISVTPIVASLGIGSLAVALALQPTLENFFSGIQLVVDKPVQVGQFIKLESGEEGTVVRIGWRSTWICLSNNNTVVMPNKLLVNSRVTNYFYPDTEVAVTVGVSVQYEADLDKVERITLDVAREVLREIPGGVPAFEPVVRYQSFDDYSIKLNVILRVKDWPSIQLLKHEFIKRLQKCYAKEGVAVAYPTRVVVQDK